jgi:alkylated DNA repair dioxygenase AlkB
MQVEDDISIETTYLSSRSWLDQGMLPQNVVPTQKEFEELWNLHPQEFGQVKLFGKVHSTPRWQKSYMKDYSFSGMNHSAEPLPVQMKIYLHWINSLGYQGEFNQVLVNWYQNGAHFISSHADDERQMVPGSPIVSISLGATRQFRLRWGNNSPQKGKIFRDFSVNHGSFLTMGGDFQKEFKHEIVKVNGYKGLQVGRRINITFRQFL